MFMLQFNLDKEEEEEEAGDSVTVFGVSASAELRSLLGRRCANCLTGRPRWRSACHAAPVSPICKEARHNRRPGKIYIIERRKPTVFSS